MGYVGRLRDPSWIPICLVLGRRKKKEREREKRETNLTVFPKLSATVRVGTEGPAQPSLSSLLSLRSCGKSPEETSTSVYALSLLALGGDGDIADLKQLKL